MRQLNSVLAGLALLAAGGLATDAQAQYPAAPYPAYPYYRPAPTPPSWSYDPYTSGLANCPQRTRTDPQCTESMPPTYGQPNYRGLSPTGWPYFPY